MTIKVVILIGGPNRGQRFRPLSFDSPKYMFPVGGQTIIGHLIDSCLDLSDCISEIILLGFYQQDDLLSPANLQKLLHSIQERRLKAGLWSGHHKLPNIKYLQEFTRMGTGGGLYHFRDKLRLGNPEAFLVLNGDVCGDYDFKLMLAQHRQTCKLAEENKTSPPILTVMTTEAGRQESLNYGCIVEDPTNHIITHYVEKPSTFVSNIISCGTYVCSLDLLNILESAMLRKRTEVNPTSGDLSVVTLVESVDQDYLSLEYDILQQREWQSRCYSYRTTSSWWCQVKTAAAAIYANRQYLKQYKPYPNGIDNEHKECNIIGDVFIHPSAHVDKTALIGPNVAIMENCFIGPGVRVKESIILQNVRINSHSLVLCSIVGWHCSLGTWVRIEGTPSEPDPNQKFAKVQNPPLFSLDGKLNPSISVLGSNVKIPDNTVILNTIVLPFKELARSYKNEIVL